METSLLRVFLQSLCNGSPWNYAVFWKLQQAHDMLLTWEDGYCNMPSIAGLMGCFSEDVYSKNLDKTSSQNFESLSSYSSGFPVTEASSSYYAFGKGIIGEVASSGMPLWVCSDHILADGYSSSLITQCPDEWLSQFAAGIKTILLIPFIPDGVLQLGSLETVVEDVGMVAIVKDMFAAHQDLAKTPSPFVLSGETHHVPMIACDVENVMKSYTSTGSSIIGSPEVIDYVGAKEDLPSITHHKFWSKERVHNFRDQETDNLLSFPKYSELEEALGLHTIGHGQLKLDSSNSGGIETKSLDCTGSFSHNRVTTSSDPNEHFIEVGGDGRNLLKAAGIGMDLGSKKRKHLVDRMDHIGYKNTTLTLEDSIPWSSITSASRDQDIWTNSLLSPASCMTTEDHQLEKECNFVYHEKELKPPSNRKRRAGPAPNEKSRPRDRQLIQDRLRELRELVPNGRKCSIDGLLDKTAKHLVFLKGVFDRSDKNKEQSLKEVLAEGTRTRLESNQNGMSWAIEVGGENNMCPIVVKDLKIPRHMLIQIVCDDFVRFLEITEVIHQLDLTVVRGVLDQQSDSRLANFVVEVPEKLHRLDIFWPLMQLVQSSVAAQNKN